MEIKKHKIVLYKQPMPKTSNSKKNIYLKYISFAPILSENKLKLAEKIKLLCGDFPKLLSIERQVKYILLKLCLISYFCLYLKILILSTYKIKLAKLEITRNNLINIFLSLN